MHFGIFNITLRNRGMESLLYVHSPDFSILFVLILYFDESFSYDRATCPFGFTGGMENAILLRSIYLSVGIDNRADFCSTFDATNSPYLLRS